MSNKINNRLIDSTITLYQYNSNSLTEENSSTGSFTCKDNLFINCLITCQLPSDFYVSKVKLKLKLLEGSLRSKLSFYFGTVSTNSQGNHVVYQAGFSEEAGLYYDSDDSYQYFDITKYMKLSTNGQIFISIIPTNDMSYFTCVNEGASIVVDGIKDEYFIKNKPVIANQIGNNTSYVIDPLHEKLIVKYSLLSINNGDLPINLSIYYDQTSQNMPIYSKYKFNYEEYITSDGSNYKYFDSNCQIHYFKSTNVSTIFNDITNPGLVLVKENNQFIIKYNNVYSKTFNQEGKLISLSLIKNDSVTATTNITYENNKIKSIIDDYGRVCNFTYTDNSIVVTLPDLKTISLNFNNGKLVSIAGVLKDSNYTSNTIFTYISIENNVVLNSIEEYNNEKIIFTYDQKGILKNSIFKILDNQISKSVYSVYDHEIVIDNYKSSSNIITQEVIQFNDEGSVISKYDIINDQICNLTSYDYDLYSSNYSLPFVEQVVYKNFDDSLYDINNNRIISLNENFLFTSNNTYSKFKFRVKFNCLISNYLPISSTPPSIKLNIYNIINNVNHLIETIDILPYINQIKAYEKEFFLEQNNDITFKAELVFEGFNGTINVAPIYIEKLNYYGSIDCIDQNTGEETVSVNNTNYYKLTKPSYIQYRQNYINSLTNVQMTKLDYLLTINSYLNQTLEHKFNLWYNNGINMIPNVTEVRLSYNNSASFSINNTKIATVQKFINNVNVEEFSVNSEGSLIKTINYYYDEEPKVVTESYNKYNHLTSRTDSKQKSITYSNYFSTIGNSITSVLSSLYSGTDSITQQMLHQTNFYIQTDALVEQDLSYPYPESGFGEGISSKIHYNKYNDCVVKQDLPNNESVNYTYLNDNIRPLKISMNIDDADQNNIYSYSENNVSGFSHNNLTNFSFVYGNRNEILEAYVNSYKIHDYQYVYDDSYTNIVSNYNCGYSESKTYDNFGRLTSISSNGQTLLDNVYSIENTNYVNMNNCSTEEHPEALLRKSKDGSLTTYYYYDSTDYNLDNPTINHNDNGYKQLTRVQNTHYTKLLGYDKKRRVSKKILHTNGYLVHENYEYINGDKFNNDLISKNSIVINSSLSIIKQNNFDVLDRIRKISYTTNGNSYNKEFTYFTSDSYTSNCCNSLSYKRNNIEFLKENLTYDQLGNIHEILFDNNTKNIYTYDELGRLVREDNQELYKSKVYEYNYAGNLISIKEYAYSTASLNNSNPMSSKTYEYDTNYPDRLNKINSDNILYGSSTNTLLPVSWGTKTLTWGKNNKLIKFKKSNSDYEITLDYNAKGQLIKKTFQVAVNTMKTIEYIYDDNRIIEEIHTTSPISIDDITPDNGLDITTSRICFIYDNEELIGFRYDNNVYYYVKDVLGNVKYLLDNNYNILCKYVYDAWGNHQVLQKVGSSYYPASGSGYIGNINPIRYKGYYYDVETNLFYLTSRYYSSEHCRFISPDSISYLVPSTINGLNLYAYCGNNPVMNVDPSGHAWYNVLKDWVNTIAGFLNPISTVTALGSIAVAAIDGRWSDVVDDWNNGCLNPFNQSESVALNSKVLSFYKGETVVRHSVPNSSSLQIFGTIFLNSNLIDDSYGRMTLNHEWGHGVQERILGPAYFFKVFVPSVAYYWYDVKVDGTSRDYYSMPWERTADWLGRVNRGNYKKGSLAWGIAENLLGPVVIPFYLLFGF